MTRPSRVDQPGLACALLARRLLGQHVGQQRHRLDIDAAPADVGHGDDGNALRREVFKPGEIVAARGDHQRRLGAGRRKSKIAPRDAAGDLQIDDAVAHPVAAHRLVQHDARARPATSAARCAVRRASGRAAPYGGARRSGGLPAPRRPRRRRRRIDSRGPRSRLRRGARQIAAIDVGDAGHGRHRELDRLILLTGSAFRRRDVTHAMLNRSPAP